MRGQFIVHGANQKPHTSILPYLRAKEKEAAERQSKKADKAQETPTTTQKEESYAEAIHKIVTGEE